MAALSEGANQEWIRRAVNAALSGLDAPRDAHPAELAASAAGMLGYPVLLVKTRSGFTGGPAAGVRNPSIAKPTGGVEAVPDLYAP
jgi:hypothetical protein